MKKLTLSIIGLIALFSLSQTVWGISLTDYKFPESTSQEGYLNATFSTENNSADTTQVGYNLGGSARYDLFYRSLPFTYQLNSSGNFSVARSTTDGAESEDAYSFLATTRANKYFPRASLPNLFGFGSARLEYRKLAAQDEADDPYADVGAGVGYGRTIDATVLKQAMRMNEDFRKYGVISRDIPDRTLLELAGIIEREDEYRSKHGEVEYRKYWYEDMEEAIRKSGVLSGETLGAMGLIRIQEVLDEPTGNRFYGWEARAGGGVVLSDFSGESGDPRLSVEFDWARPYSLQVQLTNNAYMNTVFTDDRVYNLGNIFQVYYEVSNRIDWDNRLTLNYSIPTADEAENILSLNLSSSYIFYIENQLTFTPGFVFNYLDNGVGDGEWDWKLNGSINYRFR